MLKTFPKGGIHPAENKITSSKAIKRMPVPKVVYVPIAQHIGIPAEIIVDRKDKVEKGQVIAKSGVLRKSNFISSNCLEELEPPFNISIFASKRI